MILMILLQLVQQLIKHDFFLQHWFVSSTIQHMAVSYKQPIFPDSMVRDTGSDYAEEKLQHDLKGEVEFPGMLFPKQVV